MTNDYTTTGADAYVCHGCGQPIDVLGADAYAADLYRYWHLSCWQNRRVEHRRDDETPTEGWR